MPAKLKRLLDLTDDQLKTMLEEDVFEKDRFINNIKETAKICNIDEKIVLLVIKQYITSISVVLNKYKKIKTKINVYGFFSFEIQKGKHTKY